MKRQKWLFDFLVAVFLFMVFLFLVPVVNADDQQATFAWEQSDYDNVTHWILYWGLAAGGPYTVGEARIDKTMLQPNQQADVVITYPPNTITKYYYVLNAFRDELKSPNSNEVELEVDFRVPPTVPLQLTVTITPG